MWEFGNDVYARAQVLRQLFIIDWCFVQLNWLLKRQYTIGNLNLV